MTEREEWVHVQVHTDDGLEVRHSMPAVAWEALLSAAQVGLDGATPESTGYEGDVLDEAWEVLDALVREFTREGH